MAAVHFPLPLTDKSSGYISRAFRTPRAQQQHRSGRTDLRSRHGAPRRIPVSGNRPAAHEIQRLGSNHPGRHGHQSQRHPRPGARRLASTIRTIRGQAPYKEKGLKILLDEAQIASEFKVHPNQVSDWKKRLLSGASELFERGSQSATKTEEELTAPLYEEIGRLKMDVKWLQKKL